MLVLSSLRSKVIVDFIRITVTIYSNFPIDLILETKTPKNDMLMYMLLW